jgi:hypothetical protein
MQCLVWQASIFMLSMCLRRASGASLVDPAPASIPSFHPSPSWIDSIGGKTSEENSQSAAGRDFDLNIKVMIMAAPPMLNLSLIVE